MKAFEKILISILAILFIGSVFVSYSLAAKPTQPVTEGGHAILDNSLGMAIQSDGWGEYKDSTKYKYPDGKPDGKDFVQVTYTMPNYNYLKIHAVLGKMVYFPDTTVISDRFINFCFDVLGNPLINFDNDNSNKAVYYILEQYLKTRDESGILIIPPIPTYRDPIRRGFIADNSVRAEFFTSNASGGNSGVINFLVDPSPDADCTSDKAINDPKINAFYPNAFYPEGDPPNLNYTDTEKYGERGQTFYRLNFANGFKVTRDPLNLRKWTVEPNSGKVDLSVIKYRNKGGKGVTDTIYLATYGLGVPIPFKLTVWLDPIPPEAPSKYETISTTWGSIKQ